MLDAREARALTHDGEQCGDAVRIAFDVGFHAAVREIAYPAFQAEIGGVLQDKPAVVDALNGAGGEDLFADGIGHHWDKFEIRNSKFESEKTHPPLPPRLRGGIRTLRTQAGHHAREGDGFANVREAADPADGALEAEAETRMRNTSVTAQVEEPLVSFHRQIFVLDALDEFVEVVFALCAADDFAAALGSEHVKSQDDVFVFGIALHVKRLDRRGEAVHHDGAVELVRDDGFLVAADVVAPGKFDAVLVQQLNRLGIADARERLLDALKQGNVALDDLQLLLPRFQHAVHDEADEVFGEVHVAVQIEDTQPRARSSRIR